jgi:hypothetical protein
MKSHRWKALLPEMPRAHHEIIAGVAHNRDSRRNSQIGPDQSPDRFQSPEGKKARTPNRIGLI